MTVSVGEHYVNTLGVQLNLFMGLSFLVSMCNSMQTVGFGIFILTPKSITNHQKWMPGKKMRVRKELVYVLGLWTPCRHSFWGISLWGQEGIASEEKYVTHLDFSLWIITQTSVIMQWLLHKEKAEWLYSFLNYSCVCEQFFCKRIGMGKIEVERVLSLKECKLAIRNRAWKGIHSF